VVRLGRSQKVRSSASGPHHFVEPGDTRSGLALGALQRGVQMASPLAVADASLRAAYCALSGCGRPREDSIHWPHEDDQPSLGEPVEAPRQ
jgi:hypothetical protein